MGKTGLFTLLLHIAAGTFYGYAIGFVPIYASFNEINTDCSKITGKDACTTLQHAQCLWRSLTNTTGYCTFTDYLTVNCSQPDESSCTAVSGCTYDFSSKACMHSPDWDAIKMGIFAGGLIVGGMIGSIFAGKMNDGIGRRKSVFAIALMGLIACACMTGSRVGDIYGLMVFARIVLGIACGCACVVSPSYVEEMSPDKWKSAIGSFYQISICLGIAIVAGLGYGLEPRDKTDDMLMEMRFHIIIGVQWLLTIILFVVGWIMPESDVWLSTIEKEVKNVMHPPSTLSTPRSPRGAFPFKKLLIPLVGGVFLALSLQLTGINAVMNYAPNITKAADLSPLLGNLVVMLWNFVATLISIPFASKFSPRPIYLLATLLASLACLLAGIPLYPGLVHDATLRHALAGSGVFLFVGFFQIGMGPPFYALSQRLFPPNHRAVCASFTLMIQFVANIIINVCFPIVVQALSGGPSADQNKGMSLIFIIFGGIGLLCDVVLFKTLKIFGEDEETELLSTVNN